MVTICKKCKHHRDWSPEAYGYHDMIRDYCCAPTKEISFVSGRPRLNLAECKKKNLGKCPDFKPKPEPQQLATVVLWVGVEMPEPVGPEPEPVVAIRGITCGLAFLIAVTFTFGMTVSISVIKYLVAFLHGGV